MGEEKGALRRWWSEQENRLYRSVLAFIGVDGIVVGLIEWEATYAAFGAAVAAFAIFWWD